MKKLDYYLLIFCVILMVSCFSLSWIIGTELGKILHPVKMYRCNPSHDFGFWVKPVTRWNVEVVYYDKVTGETFVDSLPDTTYQYDKQMTKEDWYKYCYSRGK